MAAPCVVGVVGVVVVVVVVAGSPAVLVAVRAAVLVVVLVVVPAVSPVVPVAVVVVLVALGGPASVELVLLSAPSVEAVPVSGESPDPSVVVEEYERDVVDVVDVPDPEEVVVVEDDELVVDEVDDVLVELELLEPEVVVPSEPVAFPSPEPLASADVGAEVAAGVSSARAASSVPTAIPA
ncbi:hypothetical protein [Blastococcus saxobsidens]|uniref:Uncharacterized protein n=1 Tax=Blastococcus saxobsidens TaxID=138336 RepID=A0A4Q7Y9Q3_9ACTN|nr:hypothetical protein [Blastococcus saxobsidens]RZU33872.1 hypothetical protein BKA19_3611 [Blastococcus saxobsidens]